MEPGTRLSHYEIRQKIGAGGMGEVYLAHDDRLDRGVALKVLLPEFCCNEERTQRFKQEAKAASALNHPNIITIHEIGEADGRLYIATEYVDGVTLREKIQSGGPPPVPEAVRIAEQIADALSAAHEAGIVHRDIKPENIMLRRRDGYVKILDFGLAKPVLQQSSSIGTEDKTLQMVQTQAGMVIGSVRYMSPEQARGKEIDQRSDVWSLGVVLYEMLAGVNPFDGETVSDSLAALIHIDPPAIENVPAELNQIVAKALRKKADDRYPTVKALAEDLKDFRARYELNSIEIKSSTGTFSAAAAAAASGKTASISRLDTTENQTLLHRTISAEQATDERERRTQIITGAHPSPPPVPRKRWLSFLPAVILGMAAVIALGAWYFQPFSQPAAAPRFESIQISRITDNGRAGSPAISPDGKYVAFVNNEGGLRSLTVRQVATGSSVQVVPPTSLGFFQPTFSRDGNYIYYTLIDKLVGTLYQVPSLGGTPKKIIVDVDSKVNFSPDGTRLAFKRHDPDKNVDAIIIAGSDGANPEVLITTAEANFKVFTEVAWAPDGERILVNAVDKIFNDGMVSSKLLTVSVRDKRVEPFGDKSWLNANSFGWLKDGSGVFLLARKSQEEQPQIWLLSHPSAEVRQITQDSSGYALMSYAPDSNTIAALRSDVISSLWSLDWQGKEARQITAESRDLVGANGVDQLPDGRLLVSKVEGVEDNLWTMDENGKNEVLLPKESGFDVQPVVSPDGKYVVFSSNSGGGDSFSLWRMDADGKNRVKLTAPPAECLDLHPDFLPDGKTVIFERRFEDRFRSKLMKIGVDGSGAEAQEIFPESQTSDASPSVSPDGKSLAYTAQSFDTKNLLFNSVVRVAAIENGAFKLTGKELNVNLGYHYRWTPDGKKLVYVGKEGVPNLFTVGLDGAPPKAVTNFSSGIILNFSLARDGKRLYVVRGIVNADLILIREANRDAAAAS